VECSARLGPHPEDEDTVQPDASDRNEAQSEGQAPDQAEAVGVRILLSDGLDVADAEQDEQDGDVGEVAHTLQTAKNRSGPARLGYRKVKIERCSYGMTMK